MAEAAFHKWRQRFVTCGAVLVSGRRKIVMAVFENFLSD
jgi:hypothetical protein